MAEVALALALAKLDPAPCKLGMPLVRLAHLHPEESHELVHRPATTRAPKPGSIRWLKLPPKSTVSRHLSSSSLTSTWNSTNSAPARATSTAAAAAAARASGTPRGNRRITGHHRWRGYDDAVLDEHVDGALVLVRAPLQAGTEDESWPPNAPKNPILLIFFDEKSNNAIERLTRVFKLISSSRRT